MVRGQSSMVRGRIGLMVVAGVLLGAVALVFVSSGLRQALVPQVILSLFTPIDLPALVEGPATDAPTTEAGNLSDTALGLVATGMIAARAGNQPVFIDAVMTGYSTPSETAVPAEITTIRPIFGCLLTEPMPGTLVGHVTAGESRMPIGMTTYGDPHLAWAVAAYVNAYRALGPEGEITIAGPRFETYDVAVTETGAPVYLVLESSGGNRIWNVHVAEGVRIERVVLLGGDQAGVANLDPVVPVEVILGPGLDECGIRPAYAPSAGQIADASETPGKKPMAQSRIDETLARAEAYDTWFHDSFGLRAGESRVGYDQGAMSVIGPIPSGEASKAAWVSIDGAEIRTTHDRFLDLDGQIAPGEDFAGRVIAIVTGFAMGDLERLRLGGEY